MIKPIHARWGGGYKIGLCVEGRCLFAHLVGTYYERLSRGNFVTDPNRMFENHKIARTVIEGTTASKFLNPQLSRTAIYVKKLDY